MSSDGDHSPRSDVESPVPSKKENSEATRKIIRVLTVLAYLSSVSMAAIMLSLYYIFLWQPTPSAAARSTLTEDQTLLLAYNSTNSSAKKTSLKSTKPEKPYKQNGEEDKKPSRVGVLTQTLQPRSGFTTSSTPPSPPFSLQAL